MIAFQLDGAAITDAVVKRFWERVDQRGPADCWLWTGRPRESGYARIVIDGRDVRVHRLALAIHLGGPFDGCALHSCDVRLCVNGGHLRAGTRAENSRDAVARRRLPRGAAHWTARQPEMRPRGERHGMARLTAEQVRELRRRRSSGDTFIELGRVFGISPTHALGIAHGDYWGHVK